jgi:hypothetical protein
MPAWSPSPVPRSPTLKAAGAEGIVEYPINKLVY